MSDSIKAHVLSIANNLSNGFDGETNNDGESISAYDYLEGVLDIEYIVASDRKTYLGARILVASGGPNIWVNTRTCTVEGHWWGDSFTTSYRDELGLNEALEDLFNC